MGARICSIAALLFHAGPVLGNTEKFILVGPDTVNIPTEPPSLDSLGLEVLNPVKGTQLIRTHLEAHFPTDNHPEGHATWLLLDHLTEGQRYEVRICWAATQPTTFKLSTHELAVVWETPELISSLNEYSLSRQSQDTTADAEDAHRIHDSDQAASVAKESEKSVLFLRILAAADYFTTNATLMHHVPPVYVDVILDPYLFQVLPRSLAPTVVYILLVAVVSFRVSQPVVAWLRALLSRSKESQEDKKHQ